MSRRIRIIVVNYRTADLVIKCLRSLCSEPDVICDGYVLVVDNASGDGGVERLLAIITGENWGAWAEVMRMDRNGGFAVGNNAGIRAALAMPDRVDYVLLLNPDTIVRPNAIKA